MRFDGFSAMLPIALNCLVSFVGARKHRDLRSKQFSDTLDLIMICHIKKNDLMRCDMCKTGILTENSDNKR